MYVPPFEPMYGLKSSLVSAIVKKLVDERTKKSNKTQRENVKVGCPHQDLQFIRKPLHEFEENKSYFADPVFSTLKKRKKKAKSRGFNKSLMLKSDPLEEKNSTSRVLKSRRTTAVTSNEDFEDSLLTRLILKRDRRGSIKLTSSNLPIRLADHYIPDTPQKSKKLQDSQGFEVPPPAGEFTNLKKPKKRFLGSKKNSAVVHLSSEPPSPISKYLVKEKKRLLHNLK